MLTPWLTLLSLSAKPNGYERLADMLSQVCIRIAFRNLARSTLLSSAPSQEMALKFWPGTRLSTGLGMAELKLVSTVHI